MKQDISPEEKEFDNWLFEIVEFYRQFDLFIYRQSLSNLEIANIIKNNYVRGERKKTEFWKSIMTYEGFVFPSFKRCWGYCFDNPALDFFEIREYTGTYKYILVECSKISQNLFATKDIKEIWTHSKSTVEVEFILNNRFQTIKLDADDMFFIETFTKVIKKINPLISDTGYQFYIIDEGVVASIFFLTPEEKQSIEQAREYMNFVDV